MTKGLAQGMDERVRPQDVLSKVTNGQWNRDGAIVKRNGFTTLPGSQYVEIDGSTKTSALMLSTTSGNVRNIVSTGDELVAVTDRYLLSYDDESNVATPVWRLKGKIAPFTGSKDTVLSSIYSFISVDTVAINQSDITGGSEGLVATVGIMLSDDGTAGASALKYGLAYKVDTQNGINVIPMRTIIAPTDTATDLPWAVRIIACSRDTAETPYIVVMVAMDKTNGDYDIYSFDALNPETFDDAMSPTVSHTAGHLQTGDYGKRTFSICDNPNNPDEFFVSYTRAGVGVEIFALDCVGGGTNHSASIATTTSTVTAIEYDNTALQLVLVYHDTSTIYVATFTDSLVANLASTALWSASASSYAQTLAIGIGNNGTEDRYTVAWCGGSGTSGDTPAQDEAFYTRYLSCNTSGADIHTSQELNNCAIVANPFWYLNDCYLPVASTSGQLAGFDSHVVMRLSLSSAAGSVAPQIAAVISPGLGGGTAVSGDEEPTLRLGSASTTSVDQDGRFNWAGSVFTFNMIPPKGSEIPKGFGFVSFDAEMDNPRFAGQVFKLLPSGQADIVSPYQGIAVLGGSVVSYYDSSEVYELGFVHPPVGDATATDEGNTGAPGLTSYNGYVWIAAWEVYDAKGILHRSSPAVGTDGSVDVTSGANDFLDINFRTLGATSRGNNPSVVVYRNSSTDATFRRANGPLRRIPNSFTTTLTSEFRDEGEYDDSGLPAMYTETGELEPTIPEGCRILRVVNDRLWAAGFYDRDRVQYSKKLTPGTANEFIVAPEFNESFAFQLPDGQECTGLGALDDKVVVFSKANTYLIAGDGPDQGGQGSDFSPLTSISSDAGCSDHRSVVSYPGGVMFQSAAGIYQVGRDHRVTFIGEAVRDDLDDFPVVVAATVVPKCNHVRFVCQNAGATSSIILVFDYRIGQWAKWDMSWLANPVTSACIHKDVYHCATGTSVLKEDPAVWKDSQDDYIPLTVKTSWIQPALPGGWARVRKVMPILSRKADMDLTCNMYHDYSATVTDAHAYTDAQLTALRAPSELVRLEMRTTKPKCQAIAVELVDGLASDNDIEDTTGQGYDIVGIMLEVGIKRGLAKVESAKKR